jgi:hypothetical protein
MFTTAGRDNLLGNLDSLFAGLLTAVSDLRAGTVTEATYTGYSATRPGVTFGSAAGSSPAGARQRANSSAVTFGTNTGSNQDMIAVGFFTANSGGTCRFIQYLSSVAPFVAVAQDGSNAIMSAYVLIQALYAHTRKLNEAARANPWYADIKDPIKFNPGIIRGGDWASSTPAWCEVDCRIGLLEGTPLAEARQQVLDAVAKAAKGQRRDWGMML